MSLSAYAKQLDHISLHEEDSELVCQYHWKNNPEGLPSQEVFKLRGPLNLEDENSALKAQLDMYQRFY